VDVDRAAARRVEHGLRQDLAERDNDRHVGAERPQAIGPLGIAHAQRLEDLEPSGQCALLHGRLGQVLPAVRGPVRLRDDRDDLVVAQEHLEGRQRERGGAVEESFKARRRGGTRPRGDRPS